MEFYDTIATGYILQCYFLIEWKYLMLHIVYQWFVSDLIPYDYFTNIIQTECVLCTAHK